MPNQIVNNLEPLDDKLTHPQVKPDLTPLKEVSGGKKPNLVVKYGVSDYLNMALPYVRESILNKMNGVSTISPQILLYLTLGVVLLGMILFILSKVGVL